MRGIALVTAVVLVAEVGDFTRFANPRQLMAYFGLVPGERSSGETTRRGGITKTGNSHARKALVEGALAYRMKPRVGRHKVDRIEALPKAVRDIAWKAQVRLCARYRQLSARGKTGGFNRSSQRSHGRWLSIPACGSTPGSAFIFVIRTAHGKGAQMRTPTGSCVSTFQKEQI
jgi:hypothetical protein